MDGSCKSWAKGSGPGALDLELQVRACRLGRAIWRLRAGIETCSMKSTKRSSRVLL